MTSHEHNRYSRQTAAYGETCGRRIFSSVCVVAWNSKLGCNAVVAETLKNLALSGVREIDLIDGAGDTADGDNGSQLDPVLDVSSNSLVHHYLLNPPTTAEVARSNQDHETTTTTNVSAGKGTLCLAFKQGLLDLNSSLVVNILPAVRKNSSVSPDSWFERVESAVSARFQQLSSSHGSSTSASCAPSMIGCFFLCHPFDRRDCPGLSAMLERLEQQNIPYTHVQSASVFGRITNNFGKGFVIVDPSASQPTQATVSKIGVVVADAGENASNDQDGRKSSGAAAREHARDRCFIELVAEDTEADAMTGSAVNEGDRFRLIHTGGQHEHEQQSACSSSLSSSSSSSTPLVEHLHRLVSMSSNSFFVIENVVKQTCPITGTKSVRYFFGISNVVAGGDGGDVAANQKSNSETTNFLISFCRAAHAGRLPLRYSQIPSPQVIRQFDVASNDLDDICDTSLLFRALTKFCLQQQPQRHQQSSQLPRIHNRDDVEKMSSILQELTSTKEETASLPTPAFLALLSPKLSSLRIRQFSRTARLQPSFFATYLGAFAAQEILKFFTQKWIPMSSPTCFDMSDCLPKQPTTRQPQPQQQQQEQISSSVSSSPLPSSSVDPNDYFPHDALVQNEQEEQLPTPDIHYSALFGLSQLEKLRSARIFLVGAGALGCEYLKIFALMGLCSAGAGVLTITDDDSIAVSNLSRQLLFRPQHVGQNKSVVAASAAKQISSLVLRHRGGAMTTRALQLRLDARSTHPVSGVFNHRFWTQQTVLLSGVDNAKARAFLSEMSQQHLLPLVDGGTNGPLGHVASILPFVTPPLQPPQSDGSSDKSIPVCTLHFFPTTVAHCSHHALDTFRHLFGESSTAEEVQQKESSDAQHESARIEEALRKALSLWFPIFVKPVLDLRKARPPDAVQADGVTPYYAAGSARRCPQVPIFDPIHDAAHRTFVCSCASLWLRYHDLAVVAAAGGNDGGDDESCVLRKLLDEKLVELATRHRWSETMQQHIKEYVPQAAVIPNETSNPDPAQTSSAKSDSMHDVVQQQQQQQQQQKTTTTFAANAMEFEKDDDDHLAFVWASTVIRARTYSIFAPTKSDVQRTAGRMVPALITTTAAVVAGGVYNAIALLLHHNPLFHNNNINNVVFKTPSCATPATTTSSPSSSSATISRPPVRNLVANRKKTSTSTVLEPLVTKEQLCSASTMLWDYMLNMADGPMSALAFQQVLDTAQEIDLGVDHKWCRLCVKVPEKSLSSCSSCSPSSLYSVANLVIDLLKLFRRETSEATLKASGLEKLTPPAIRQVIDDDLQNPKDIESSRLSVILKLRIGVTDEVVFQHTANTSDCNNNSNNNAGMTMMMDLLPAHLLIKEFLMKSVKTEPDSSTSSALPTPPFVECELFVHLLDHDEDGSHQQQSDETSKHAANGLTIFARLQL